MKYVFLTLLSISILFLACSKKSNPASSRANMLRTGKWKMSSGSLSVKLPGGIRDTTLNYLTYVPACHLDDYIDFGPSTFGSVFSGSLKCSPNDPDSVQFQWGLSNNDNNISLFRGFSVIWSVKSIVWPYSVDTTQFTPFLALDTLHGVNDTLPGYTRQVVVLDSFWTVKYYSDSVPNFDIYNAQISDFSQSSFTIIFSMYSTYMDTTHNHTGILAGTTDMDPVVRPDTVKYKLTFTNQ